MEYVLEACVDSVESAIAAQQGGAKRVELCGNLIIGGTSPGKALFQAVRKYTDLEIRVLLRPRFGDFCYDEYEFEIMKEDVQMYRELGADGIVTGILLPDGRLDSVRMGELIREAGNADVALHRAFDVCSDPYETLEGAVDLGIKTILTSGQKNSAWEGRELLRELVRRSDGSRSWSERAFRRKRSKNWFRLQGRRLIICPEKSRWKAGCSSDAAV